MIKNIFVVQRMINDREKEKSFLSTCEEGSRGRRWMKVGEREEKEEIGTEEGNIESGRTIKVKSFLRGG